MTEPRPDYENDHARDIPPRVATRVTLLERQIRIVRECRDKGLMPAFYRQLARLFAMVEGEE